MKTFCKVSIFLCQTWFYCFGQPVFIKNVPDQNQPPLINLPSTIDTTNYCSPFAFLNIVEYWDIVNGHPQAAGLMAGLPPRELAEYIGWFMDTNDNGSPARINGSVFPRSQGTYIDDQAQGALEFVSFDAINTFGFPFPVPPQKNGYVWNITVDFSSNFGLYVTEIDSGYPVKLDFLYWQILPTGDYIFDPLIAQDTIHIYRWGSITDTSGFDPNAPSEKWNLEQGLGGIGHAVTGVGYIIDTLEFAIVHDNWASTPKNIAVPWFNNIPWPNIPAMLIVRPPGPVGAIENRNNPIKQFRLSQNYPNPFNPATTITFELKKVSWVELKIYDTLGREISTLIKDKKSPGHYEIDFDAANLNSGLYFYKLTVDNFSETKMMQLVK